MGGTLQQCRRAEDMDIFELSWGFCIRLCEDPPDAGRNMEERPRPSLGIVFLRIFGVPIEKIFAATRPELGDSRRNA